MISLNERLRLTYVPRWVIVPMMRTQSVAEHSWRVAIIVDELLSRMRESRVDTWSIDPMSVQWGAMIHDLDEALTGDIPSSAKPPREVPTDPFTLLLKVADDMESRTWLILWGHPTVGNIVEEADRRWRDLLVAFNNKFPGGADIAQGMCDEILRR